jgi:hypothetical protein
VEGSDLCLPQRETGVILCMYVCTRKQKTVILHWDLCRSMQLVPWSGLSFALLLLRLWPGIYSIVDVSERWIKWQMNKLDNRNQFKYVLTFTWPDLVMYLLNDSFIITGYYPYDKVVLQLINYFICKIKHKSNLVNSFLILEKKSIFSASGFSVGSARIKGDFIT